MLSPPAAIRPLPFARCHSIDGHAVFECIAAAPLLAYLRTSEKRSARTGKIVYNCLPPDEWGEKLPVHASFRHGYPQAIVARFTDLWQEYGLDTPERGEAGPATARHRGAASPLLVMRHAVPAATIPTR